MLQHPCLQPCFFLLFLLFPAKYSLSSCKRRTKMSLLANLLPIFATPVYLRSFFGGLEQGFFAFLSGLCFRFDVSYKVFYVRIFLLSFSNLRVFLIFFGHWRSSFPLSYNKSVFLCRPCASYVVSFAPRPYAAASNRRTFLSQYTTNHSAASFSCEFSRQNVSSITLLRLFDQMVMSLADLNSCSVVYRL